MVFTTVLHESCATGKRKTKKINRSENMPGSRKACMQVQPTKKPGVVANMHSAAVKKQVSNLLNFGEGDRELGRSLPVGFPLLGQPQDQLLGQL